MPKSLIPVNEAGRWVECNGSVIMQAQFPSLPGEQSQTTAEGIAFHWLADTMAKTFIDGTNASPTRSDYVDQPAPNGVIIDDMMYQSAVDWCTEIFRYCNVDGVMRSVHLETNLPADFIREGEVCRPDAWIHNEKSRELVIMDAKYGHTFVEVFENWPLILYAHAVMEYLGLNGIDDQYYTIRLGVFQPRAFHPDGTMRWWTFPASELRGHVNKAINAASVALKDGAPTRPGTWCRGCSGRRACAALQGSVYATLDHIADSDTFAELDDDNLSLELRLLRHGKKLLQSRLDALEEQAKHKLQNGGRLKGFAMQMTKGREVWSKPFDEVVMMGDMFGADLRKPPEAITPAAARKKGVDESVIKAYATRHTSGTKLVEEDVARARQAFKHRGNDNEQ